MDDGGEMPQHVDVRIHYDMDHVDTDDSDAGGDDSDEEYVEGRINKKSFRVAEFDTFRGLNVAEIEVSDVDGENSEYSDSDQGLLTPGESDDDMTLGRKKKTGEVWFNSRNIVEGFQFKLGTLFVSRVQLKEGVQQWAIINGHNITWVRSNEERMECICDKECTWRFYAARRPLDRAYELRIYESKHTCYRKVYNKQATVKWMANEFLQKFRRNPLYQVGDMQADVELKYGGLKIMKSSCYRARYLAKKIIRGSIEEHYAKFRAYDAELKRVDREGVFLMYTIPEPETGAPMFQRYYVGFSALRKGFMEGCRPILCVDGCFLKTLCQGVLLSAVGRDGNDQMFPVAWALVEGENEATWTWFLEILLTDLNMMDGAKITIVSDQQKGLANAIRVLVPNAEHRNCARHIFANWKKMHKDPELKRLFWLAVNSTYEAAFNRHMEDMMKVSLPAHDDFKRQGPRVFCKAFIRTLPCCDAITSNMAETFNGYICKARQMPAVQMLEEIRMSLMERMFQKHKMMEKNPYDVGERIVKKVEKNQLYSRFCLAKPALGGNFQVSWGKHSFIVNLRTRSCSCQEWQLTGIPCAHGLSGIHYMKYNAMDFIDVYYKKDKYFKAYNDGLQPINGSPMWPDVPGYPILPPPYKKQPGRPKKNRKKAREEEPKSLTRLRRGGLHMTCSHCLGVGHNKRACPNKDNPPTERPPKNRTGRPRKTPYTEASTSTPQSAPATNSAPQSQVEATNTIHEPAATTIATESGLVFLRGPQVGVKYVSGSASTAAAARASNPARKRKNSATCIQESQPTTASQPPVVCSQDSSSNIPLTSVKYKSTASQQAAPRSSRN